MRRRDTRRTATPVALAILVAATILTGCGNAGVSGSDTSEAQSSTELASESATGIAEPIDGATDGENGTSDGTDQASGESDVAEDEATENDAIANAPVLNQGEVVASFDISIDDADAADANEAGADTESAGQAAGTAGNKTSTSGKANTSSTSAVANTSNTKVPALDAGISLSKLQQEIPNFAGVVSIPDIDLLVAVQKGTVSKNLKASLPVISLNKSNGTDGTDPNIELSGSAETSTDTLYALLDFTDEQFFGRSHQIYYYTTDTAYAYEVFAAYPSENEDLLTAYNSYDYTEYVSYINAIYGLRGMGTHLKTDMVQEVAESWQIISLKGIMSDGTAYIVQGTARGTN